MSELFNVVVDTAMLYRSDGYCQIFTIEPWMQSSINDLKNYRSLAIFFHQIFMNLVKAEEKFPTHIPYSQLHIFLSMYNQHRYLTIDKSGYLYVIREEFESLY